MTEPVITLRTVRRLQHRIDAGDFSIDGLSFLTEGRPILVSGHPLDSSLKELALVGVPIIIESNLQNELFKLDYPAFLEALDTPEIDLALAPELGEIALRCSSSTLYSVSFNGYCEFLRSEDGASERSQNGWDIADLSKHEAAIRLSWSEHERERARIHQEVQERMEEVATELAATKLHLIADYIYLNVPERLLNRLKRKKLLDEQTLLLLASSFYQGREQYAPYWVLKLAQREFQDGEKKPGGRKNPRGKAEQLKKDISVLAHYKVALAILKAGKRESLRGKKCQWIVSEYLKAHAYPDISEAVVNDTVKRCKDLALSLLEAASMATIDYSKLSLFIEHGFS